MPHSPQGMLRDASWRGDCIDFHRGGLIRDVGSCPWPREPEGRSASMCGGRVRPGAVFAGQRLSRGRIER